MRASWLLAALLLPGALAHGGAYDPLVVDLHAFLTADGRIDERAPEPGSVAFAPGAPGEPAPPLRFTFAAPVRSVPGAAFEATLLVRAQGLVVARDAEGNAFEVTVEPGGEPQRVALAEPAMAPGATASVVARVQAPGALYEEGQNVTLVVRPLMPLAEGALVLLVGPEGSRFDAPDMRVPTPGDLRLQALPHTEFLLEGESFQPPADHAVNVVSVTHGSIAPPAVGAWSANGTYVVLRGDETDAEAQAHSFPDRERRVEAAHELRVNGLTARAHPGVGVVVRVLAPPIRVECVRNCDPAFSWTYAPPASDGAEPPSALVPPPRDTRGIPQSGDEPPARETPVAAFAALAALVLAARAKR